MKKLIAEKFTQLYLIILRNRFQNSFQTVKEDQYFTERELRFAGKMLK
jgi:hypothetical protein